VPDPRPMTAAEIEALIRRYFDACNAADVHAIAECFVPEAVHYFPPGMYGGPFRGARTIGERWMRAVRELGSSWTVDQVISDPATHRAVIEWTHHKGAGQGVLLRGDEWYVFDPATHRIAEIRAYYAAPQAPDLRRMELDGFPYAERGYPMPKILDS
jgi:methyltransferase